MKRTIVFSIVFFGLMLATGCSTTLKEKGFKQDLSFLDSVYKGEAPQSLEVCETKTTQKTQQTEQTTTEEKKPEPIQTPPAAITKVVEKVVAKPCKDYGNDIQELRNRVAQLETVNKRLHGITTYLIMFGEGSYALSNNQKKFLLEEIVKPYKQGYIEIAEMVAHSSFSKPKDANKTNDFFEGKRLDAVFEFLDHAGISLAKTKSVSGGSTDAFCTDTNVVLLVKWKEI